MSSSHLYSLAGYPKAVLANGLGRYICPLQRITLKFCKSHGGSRGVREFIENDLVDFAKSNPSVVVYVKPRRHRTPVFVAEYINGERKWMSINNLTREEIINWINVLKSQSGYQEKRLLKYIRTNNPSIQGPWNPFLFKNPDFNITSFPDDKYSLPKNLEPTATEIVIEKFKAQKIKEEHDKLLEEKEKVEVKI